MAHINIRRKHTLGQARAREAAESMAAQLNKKHQLDYYWEGDTLHFERSGVNGYLSIEPAEVQVYARLGFLLTPLKPTFEKAIHHYLDKLLARG